MSSSSDSSPDADMEEAFAGRCGRVSPLSRSMSPFRGISPVNVGMEGCEAQDIIQVHRARLEQMMCMSNYTKLPTELRLTYEERGLPALDNRARAVRWITEVRAFSFRLIPRAVAVRCRINLHNFYLLSF